MSEAFNKVVNEISVVRRKGNPVLESSLINGVVDAWRDLAHWQTAKGFGVGLLWPGQGRNSSESTVKRVNVMLMVCYTVLLGRVVHTLISLDH